MGEMQMAYKKILLRRDTASIWTSANPILFSGEIGYETDTGRFKIGNGSTAWASLAYSAASSLDDLGNVTVPSPSSGDLLKWNGTAWVNASGYALLASPALTGTPTAPTATAATNTTQVATTAFVRGEVTALVASAPATLDTLNELALALGSDASFSTTVATSLGLKAPLASPTFTGTPTLPTGTIGTTQTAGNSTTALATTAFVATAVSNVTPSTTVLDGGTPETIQFYVMGAVNAGVLV